MKKVISVVVLMSVLLSGFVTTQAAISFKDMKSSDWFYENVSVLVDKGIIGGYPDGTFKPNDTMSADQFIKTMVVAMGYTFNNGTTYWAQPYVDKAIALGIVKKGEFSTYTKAITRADMCRISVRVVESLEGKKTYQYDAKSNNQLIASIYDVNGFKEGDKLPISNAYELGILGGYPDNEFKPYIGLKRSEACTVITRVIDSTKRLTLKLSTVATWETIVINGWTVPKVNREIIIYDFSTVSEVEEGYAEISLVIILGNLGTTLNEQYIAVEQALRSKYSKDIVNQVMDYVKLKTNSDYDLPLKMIDIGDKIIWIYSSPNSGISVQIFKEGTY